jgi:protein O-GlcNAc transferase
LNPNFADAHCGRGNVFTALNRYDDALAAYDKALSLKPHLAEAWLGRGTVLTDLNRYNDVFAAYDKAFSLQPDLSSAEGSRLFAKMYCCIWSDLDAECEHLLQSIRLGKQSADPFVLFSTNASPADQLQCADIWVRTNHFAPAHRYPSTGPKETDKIRIAYLSADFHRHPTACMMTELFELHDRARFEALGISFGPDDGSDTRSRLIKSFDQFQHRPALVG